MLFDPRNPKYVAAPRARHQVVDWNSLPAAFTTLFFGARQCLWASRTP